MVKQSVGLTWTDGTTGVGLDTVPQAQGSPIEGGWVGTGSHSLCLSLSTLDRTLCPRTPTGPAAVDCKTKRTKVLIYQVQHHKQVSTMGTSFLLSPLAP